MFIGRLSYITPGGKVMKEVLENYSIVDLCAEAESYGEDNIIELHIMRKPQEG